MNTLNATLIGVGYLSPDGTGKDVFFQQVNEGNQNENIENYDPQGYLGRKGLRFIGNASKMYCNLAFQCLEQNNLKAELDLNPNRFGLYDGSELANLEDAVEFDLVAKVDGPSYVSPMKTPNTLANASASLMAIKSGIKGPNFSVAGGTNGSLQALDIATLHLKNHIVDYGIVVSTDSDSYCHQVVRRGENDQANIRFASPFGIAFTMTTKEIAQERNYPSLCDINYITSGHKLQIEDNSDLLVRLMENIVRQGLNMKDVDAIVLGGMHNLDLNRFIEELWWTFELKDAKLHLPERLYGVCDNSAGSIGILYSIGLAQQQIKKSSVKKVKKCLVCTVDKLGYGMVSLITV